MKRSSLLSLALLAAACTRADDVPAHDHGHDHGDADHAVKTDPHHVAENHTDCDDDVVLPDGAIERYGIEVAPVRAMALTPTLFAPGHLAFPQGAIARVRSAVEGRVVEVRVHTGDLVAKGDVLFTVESSALGEAQSDYLQKRTVAAAAAPAVERARTALERARELHERVQGVALSEVQKREADLAAAERDRDLARASESAALHRLLLLGMSEPDVRALAERGRIEPRSNVVAPIQGRIVELSAAVGELVGPHDERMAVVGDPSKLWAIAEVSETRLAEVALGARAKVRVPAIDGKTCEGRVAALATVIEAATRTAEVRIELDNADGTLLPGMFLQVEIESSRGAGEPRLAVPDGAVLDIEGKPSVFVPLSPGASVFCKHAIEVGEPVGESIPVLAGLSAGDLVVVAGAFRLKAEHGKASAQHDH